MLWIVLMMGTLGALTWKNHQINRAVLRAGRDALVQGVRAVPEDQDGQIVHSHTHDSIEAIWTIRQQARRRLWIGWAAYALVVAAGVYRLL